MTGRRGHAGAGPGALRRLARRAAAAALLALAGSAAAGPPVLTLAVAESPYAAPALIAESQGWFAAEGLELKVLRCTIGRVCLKHLLEGRAHLATVADTPITVASFERRDFAVVATLATSGREHRLVVREDRAIGGVADLKGKRIGMLRGTSGHYFADTLLLLNGLRATDASLVPLDPADVTGPLLRGEVDAAALFEPHASRALQGLGPNGRALPTPGFFTVTFNLVSVAAAAGARDEDVAKLLRALKRAAALIQAEPARAQALLAEVLKADARELVAGWGAFDYRIQLAQPLVTSLEAQARWAVRERLVPEGAQAPVYLDLLRPAPLRSIDPHAVRTVF